MSDFWLYENMEIKPQEEVMKIVKFKDDGSIVEDPNGDYYVVPIGDLLSTMEANKKLKTEKDSLKKELDEWKSKRDRLVKGIEDMVAKLEEGPGLGNAILESMRKKKENLNSEKHGL